MLSNVEKFKYDVLQAWKQSHEKNNPTFALAILKDWLTDESVATFPPGYVYLFACAAVKSFCATKNYKDALPFALLQVKVSPEVQNKYSKDELGILHVEHSNEILVAIHELGTIQFFLSHMEEAKKAFLDECALISSMEEVDSTVALNAYSWLASTEYALLNYHSAIDAFLKAKDHAVGSTASTKLTVQLVRCYLAAKQWENARGELTMGICRADINTAKDVHAELLHDAALMAVWMKQYEIALKWIPDSVRFSEKFYGKDHSKTVQRRSFLDMIVKLSKVRNRGNVKTVSKIRMCCNCGEIREGMPKCACHRAWYCNAECQQMDWETHRPDCLICINCWEVDTELKRCSKCHKTRYCSAECQREHWQFHKEICK